MRKSIALLGMAAEMMATATTASQPMPNLHSFGDTLSYNGGSSRQSKYKRDRVDPLKAERIAKSKRRASKKARKKNRFK